MGTPFNDVIHGTPYNDDDTVRPSLHGLDGNDKLYGKNGNDRLYGENGDDQLYGENGDDQLYGGAGNDQLYGQDGHDILNGGIGTETMYGGAGNDTYYLDTKFDQVIEYGSAGIDKVKSYVSLNRSLPDNVEHLTLMGMAYRGDGNGLSNGIQGNASANALYGYGGNDYLYGLGGNDYLTGGLGKDHIWGNGGEDRYVYSSISESPEGAGRDVIYDFEGGLMLGGDVIDLSQIDGNAVLPGHQDLTCSQLTWASGVLKVDVWNYGDSIDMQIEVAALNCSDIYV